ncbi:MAG: porin family protein [Spirochaetia bacterium]|nr:porin family protein [Spirochaetia bacterium]
MKKIIYLFLAAATYMLPAVCGDLYADEMQKVIILPFKNIDKNPNYEYLEATITDSIRAKLKTKFAFSETPEQEWKTVAKKNFLYDNECYTATYGINLGLYSTQDVVINGGFIIKQGGKDQDAVSTTVRIISITEKRVIAEQVIEIPANNQLFTTIGEVADKAAKEASKVLPNKEDWEKNRGNKKPAKKIFANIALGLRAGGNFFAGGWSDQFSTKLPAFGFLLRGNMPIVWDQFFIEAGLSYYQHEIKKGATNYFTANNLTLLATNLMMGGAVGVDFRLSDIFYISPKLGGGVINQSSQVSGSVSQNVTNDIPYVSAGFEFAWLATDTLRLVFDGTFNAQIESFKSPQKTIFTYIPMAQLGINVNF